MSIKYQIIAEKENLSLIPLKLFDGKNHYCVTNDQVLAVCADKNYLSVFTTEREIIIRSTLKSMIEKLNNNQMLQVSRSAVVNKDAIIGLHKYSKTSFKVQLSDKLEVKVSKKYLTQIQSLVS